jgi:hypothetical protein
VGCHPGKIISRKDAEAQGRTVFFFAAWRLCEKKIISREAAKPPMEGLTQIKSPLPKQATGFLFRGINAVIPC